MSLVRYKGMREHTETGRSAILFNCLSVVNSVNPKVYRNSG